MILPTGPPSEVQVLVPAGIVQKQTTADGVVVASGKHWPAHCNRCSES